jgi:exodeoxyribonuclease VII small subunit
MVRRSESYESMRSRLDEILQLMEQETLSLEETMKIYEEGIKLSNKLYKLLEEAEGKIRILTNDGEKNFLENEE